jgi:hypothetical protein
MPTFKQVVGPLEKVVRLLLKVNTFVHYLPNFNVIEFN